MVGETNKQRRLLQVPSLLDLAISISHTWRRTQTCLQPHAPASLQLMVAWRATGSTADAGTCWGVANEARYFAEVDAEQLQEESDGSQTHGSGLALYGMLSNMSMQRKP